MNTTLALILIVCLSIGCDNNEPNNYQNAGMRRGNAHLNTVVYDSCEYIYDSNAKMSVPVPITHKGNCKFCAERSK